MLEADLEAAFDNLSHSAVLRQVRARVKDKRVLALVRRSLSRERLSGTSTPFIDDRPVRSLKAKIRALTRRTSQLDPGYVLTRLNQVMHGWANYFRHAVAKNAFGMLDNFAWRRVTQMLRTRHRWRWKDVRRQLTAPDGGWLPITAGQIELRRIAAIPVTRYRYRGNTIPSPWTAAPA